MKNTVLYHVPRFLIRRALVGFRPYDGKTRLQSIKSDLLLCRWAICHPSGNSMNKLNIILFKVALSSGATVLGIAAYFSLLA